MQITPWLIYWIDVIHSICTLGNVLVFGSVLLIGLSGLIYDGKPTAEWKKAVTFLLWPLCIGAVICIFVPSKTVMMQMLILPPVVTSEQVQELPSNVLEYVNNWLEEANAELREKKK